MKHYKDYEKVCIGGSDIASIIVRQPLEVKEIHIGEDGTYYAYIIDTEEDVFIGEHYTKVYESNTWISVYDDDGRVLKLKGNYDTYIANKTFIFKKTKRHNFEMIYDKKIDDWRRQEYYDINEIEELQKKLCKEENIGKVIIFKNERENYIKGLIFSNCISIGNSCEEYEYIDDCANGNEIRRTANSQEIVEGLKFSVKIESK